MQYTLRKIPKNIDQALRRRARAERRSLNDVALEALARGLELAAGGARRDLSDLSGKWEEDAEFDQILKEQRKVDAELWR